MALRLKVRGVPRVLVPHPFAIGRNPPRYVGKALAADPPIEPYVDRFNDVDDDVPDHPVLREAVRLGHLVALDAQTAAVCGVVFNASRGDE